MPQGFITDGPHLANEKLGGEASSFFPQDDRTRTRGKGSLCKAQLSHPAEEGRSSKYSSFEVAKQITAGSITKLGKVCVFLKTAST